MPVAETSIGTYHELRREGALGPMQRAVLAAIREHPGHTDRELAALAGQTDPNAIRPRRTELYHAGLVEPAGKRRCRVTGRGAQTWRVTERRAQMELGL